MQPFGLNGISEPRWYAVQTRSRHEKLVARELAARQVDYYLPLVPCRKRRSDRYVVIQEPLFPGYVFTRLVYPDCDQRINVLDTRGVVRFLGDGVKAWPVSDEEVLSVKAVVQARVDCSPYPYLREGAYVEVIHGPLKHAKGILVEEPKNHRLVVSISLFAQSISAEVDVGDVRLCEEAC